MEGSELITRLQGDVTAEVQLGAHKFTKVHMDILKPCRPRSCLGGSGMDQADIQVRITEEVRSASQEMTTQMDSLEEAPDNPADTPTTAQPEEGAHPPKPASHPDP